MNSVTIEGLPSLTRLLNADLNKAVGAATFAIAAEIQNRLAPYPAASEANRPRSWQSGGPNQWYERGYGPRWVRKDGSINGRKTSQTLNRRWSIQRGVRSATLWNKAGYSGFVHDANIQAAFHKRRGWRTDQDVINQVQGDGTVSNIVNQALTNVFNGG